MTRIFAPLAVLSLLLMGLTVFLGLRIGDAATASEAKHVSVHLLSGLGTIVFSLLVHALVLTYFMGTGRWLEETCQAYRLEARLLDANRSMKWQVYPLMMLCLTLLLATGGLGAAADPASPVGFRGWGELSGAKVHFLAAMLMWIVTCGAYGWEYLVLRRNGEIVTQVLARVREIRTQHGLPVE